MTSVAASGARSSAVALLLRVLVAAGLTVDAIIHFQLAPLYQLAQPNGVGEGNLFRIEAVSALLAAAYVLLRGSRPAYAVAAMVALGGAAVVVLYRYVDVAAIGPIPHMYEPIWFFKKTLSAIVEAGAGVLALLGLATTTHVRGSDPR